MHRFATAGNRLRTAEFSLSDMFAFLGHRSDHISHFG
ncbi:hypothetical protein E5Q_00517 [Mixia osmundae IAM 14324]|uniref:Uncharacterized protein n=1 Tax=Mixia osmundae (strain CBS 9802 / IAM 14324 / JCM 22182 / KY 12970) TaxID=764103 RepID=G7DTM4_MIXOS|nr:hypothetical protein E5Q_00517 [Mixia osmundae IAM 14324]